MGKLKTSRQEKDSNGQEAKDKGVQYLETSNVLLLKNTLTLNKLWKQQQGERDRNTNNGEDRKI